MTDANTKKFNGFTFGLGGGLGASYTNSKLRPGVSGDYWIICLIKWEG